MKHDFLYETNMLPIFLTEGNVSLKLEVKEEKADESTFDISELEYKRDPSKPLLDLIHVKDELPNLDESLKEEKLLIEYEPIKEESFTDEYCKADSKELLDNLRKCIKEESKLLPIVLLERCVSNTSLRTEHMNKNGACLKSRPTVKKTYVKELKFGCHHCGKKFTQSDVLRRHIRIHTGQKPHSCEFCNKSFRTKALLKNHQQLHTGKRFKCIECNQEFQQIGGLQAHLLAHKGIKPVSCSVCQTGFTSKTAVARHIKRFHSNGQEKQDPPKIKRELRVGLNTLDKTNSDSRVQCPECKKYFATKRSLFLHHKRMHTVKNNAAFVCGDCNKGFAEKHLLKVHIMGTHMDLKSEVCQYCNKTYKNKFYLNIHVKNHHNVDKSDTFFCDICHMGFRKSCYLTRHMKTHSGEDKKCVCDTCGQKCRSKTDMQYHVMKHMDGYSKPYKCNKCNQAFAKATKLKRHQAVHSNKKPFKCHYCDKGYKDANSLKTHEQTVHLGVTFTCETCGFHSINECSFKRHLRQNLCAKNLFCKDCDEDFSDKQLYQCHMEKLHSKHGLHF